MAMEKGLYTQVVMIRRKYSDSKREKTKKYNPQRHPARSICWSDLDNEGLEETFSTRCRIWGIRVGAT